MTHAAISAEVDQALDRELNFTTKIAFDGELRDRITNAFEFSIGKVLNLLRAGDAALFKNQAAARTADAIDGGETDFGVLLRRNINTGDTSQCVTSLALTLLVTRVAADHADNAFALDDLAVAAHFLNGSSNLHLNVSTS